MLRTPFIETLSDLFIRSAQWPGATSCSSMTPIASPARRRSILRCGFLGVLPIMAPAPVS
jgi:hypothetical protein